MQTGNDSNMIDMGGRLILVTPGNPGQIETEACRIFAERVMDRGPYEVAQVSASQYQCDDARYPIFVGCRDANRLVIQALDDLHLTPVSEPEGFLLHVGDTAIVNGADENGVLYGLGRLLRLMDYGETGISVKAVTESQHPVGKARGVYFATHFNNWYESAPIEELDRYIEDMALWGVNTLWTWFDMNWYPADFWQNPDSRGMRMIRRIRRIYEIGHSLGMKVGSTGIANEGFSRQPPEELQVDPSAQRGGFYPHSQICPSKPGGMDLILQNRRKALELIGPIDAFWYWPYDQGGCGCRQCMDENGWGRKFLEIGPAIAGVVKDLNPTAESIISTWLMNDAEIDLVRKLMDSGADWFDGVLVETRRAGEFTSGCGYSLSVFPEISMFETFFVSYGCNGANPAPVKFAEEARRIAQLGYGSVVYSEGIYEDINKLTWAAVMWDPSRSAADIVTEYCRYYFGIENERLGGSLVHKLEDTWGVFKLPQTSLGMTEEIMGLIQRIGANLPGPAWCKWRLQVLADRAKLDHLMVKIGPGTGLMKEAKEAFDDAGYSDDLKALRLRLESFRDDMRERVRNIDALFAAYWDYLKRFHLESVMLVFKPDQFLGSTEYSSLLTACDESLSMESDEEMREAFIRAVHRWFWFNGVGAEFLFL